MGIVQETIDKKDTTGLTFADLVHMPYVTQPDSIDGITEEWFEFQKKVIDEKISAYELSSSIPQTARRWETDKLRKLIEQLRKFTTKVLKERSRLEQAIRPVIPPENERDPITEMYERQRDYDVYVDHLLDLKKKDEQFARQTEFIRKSPKKKANFNHN